MSWHAYVTVCLAVLCLLLLLWTPVRRWLGDRRMRRLRTTSYPGTCCGVLDALGDEVERTVFR